MKKCPHCAKWFFNNSSLIILFLCVGPLVLPLVWVNPRFNRNTKLIITIIIAVVTYFAWIAMAEAFKTISSYYRQAFY